MPVLPNLPDLTGLPVEQLDDWLAAITAEVHRRRVLADASARVEQVQHRAETEIDAIAAEYLAARDGAVDEEDPLPWKHPTGAHNAYPKDWPVSHAGKRWRSLVGGNGHEPGTDHGQAWVQIVPEPTPGEYVAWGSGQQVKAGDLRTHEGHLWRAKLEHTTHDGWAPSPHAHAVWEDLGLV